MCTIVQAKFLVCVSECVCVCLQVSCTLPREYLGPVAPNYSTCSDCSFVLWLANGSSQIYSILIFPIYLGDRSTMHLYAFGFSSLSLQQQCLGW